MCCRPSTRSGSPGRGRDHLHKHKLLLTSSARRWLWSNLHCLLQAWRRRHIMPQVHQLPRTRPSPLVHHRGPRLGRRPRRSHEKARAAADVAVPARAAANEEDPLRYPTESMPAVVEEVGSAGSPPPSSDLYPSCPSSLATTPATTKRRPAEDPSHLATQTTTTTPRPITGPSCTVR